MENCPENSPLCPNFDLDLKKNLRQVIDTTIEYASFHFKYIFVVIIHYVFPFLIIGVFFTTRTIILFINDLYSETFLSPDIFDFVRLVATTETFIGFLAFLPRILMFETMLYSYIFLSINSKMYDLGEVWDTIKANFFRITATKFLSFCLLMLSFGLIVTIVYYTSAFAILLIIPVLYVFNRLSLSTTIVVFEKTNVIQSFKRSIVLIDKYNLQTAIVNIWSSFVSITIIIIFGTPAFLFLFFAKLTPMQYMIIYGHANIYFFLLISLFVTGLKIAMVIPIISNVVQYFNLRECKEYISLELNITLLEDMFSQDEKDGQNNPPPSEYIF